jgi:hypothetical protein
MTQTEFVRQYVMRHFDREAPDIDRLVREGERLWQRLTERGYGARQDKGPREHVDWYSRLSPDQQALFDRFWAAFNLKRGKQGAAMRWGQICPDADTAEHMIEAAAKEAEQRKKLPDGQSPIMAQGWLQQRRWEDYPASSGEAEASGPEAHAGEVRRVRGELAHLERLVARERNDETRGQLAEQADALRERLAALEGDDG